MTRGGTGKTYASAFAIRELGFKRVLFLVHRGQLARQTKKSYEKIFDKSVSMGLVGEMKMHHPVREDLLRYLQSNLQQSIQNNTQELKAI